MSTATENKVKPEIHESETLSVWKMFKRMFFDLAMTVSQVGVMARTTAEAGTSGARTIDTLMTTGEAMAVNNKKSVVLGGQYEHAIEMAELKSTFNEKMESLSAEERKKIEDELTLT